jgi:alpha-L-fucosidase
VDSVRLLGLGEDIEWKVSDGALRVRLPERMPVSPAHVIALGPGARPA